MALVGFHASHEQFAPSELLRLVQAAEAAGFQAAMCSDHFHPWSRAQGQSGHAWAWLGAAMARTRLGWEATVPLEDGLAQTARWIEARAHRYDVERNHV